jgi:hypothetical protein
MSNKDYNYEIEKTLAKYGGEADKGVERTCGNCESYIKEIIALKEEKRHAITHADMVQLETEAINKKEQDQQ